MHELDPTMRALLANERAARLAADFAPRARRGTSAGAPASGSSPSAFASPGRPLGRRSSRRPSRCSGVRRSSVDSSGASRERQDFATLSRARRRSSVG